MADNNYLKDYEESIYPNEIDPLLFITDTSLNDYEWRNNYEAFVESNPDSASNMLESNSYYSPINAYLFNCIVSRIKALQKYLLEKEDTMVRIEFDDEPTELINGKTWFKEK